MVGIRDVCRDAGLVRPKERILPSAAALRVKRHPTLFAAFLLLLA